MIKIFALGAALAASGVAAQAQTLSPVHAKTLELGSTRGSAYYVPRADGYHLVATLYSEGAGTPVRFNTILSNGQSASVSVPGIAGGLAHEIVFSASTDGLVVRDAADATQ